MMTGAKTPDPVSLTWFQSVPRRFFRYPTAGFSAYVGIGFMVAGFLHYRIWMQSAQVETVFTNLGFRVPPPRPQIALMLFVALGLSTILVFHALFRRVAREGGALELVFWGTVLSATLAWVPWLFASSVVTTLFLFLFGMNAVVGFAMRKRLGLDQDGGHGEVPFDPWKMFVNATKTSAAVIALLLGAIATGVLLPWRNTQVEDPGLFRYAILCAYVVAGMLLFILMPLLARTLEKAPSEEVELEVPDLL